ncbi:hypothetical protein LTR78_003033 [Recurvomyces mirabilis]|uniref:Uncharacterized protein n=1 Tax=Recurvomyces mirabilis TaxID=574656 RepID=A0AAE0WS55_9PEZI|nr:hypothetical protein LTR78_003033 [Recurvomyces mirabilis]KAK5157145.1 hypothetical protein LTS14_004663 [Recurvomyces mirabilis]
MAREQQKNLAQKFIESQGKWDTAAVESTLASDAKHDLLPASLGVGQKDNAGKLEVIKKMGAALDNKPVNIKILQTIQDVEQRKTALFVEKEYDFGAVQSFFVVNFNESNDKITHTVEFVNAEAQKKLMSRMG